MESLNGRSLRNLFEKFQLTICQTLCKQKKREQGDEGKTSETFTLQSPLSLLFMVYSYIFPKENIFFSIFL
jgi:hypothetical protein